MFNPELSPPEVMPSMYGPRIRETRSSDLPDMAAVSMRDLFPEIKQGFSQKEGLDDICKVAEKELSGVDMDKIKPGDKVNILCSEHGFSLLEGLHYREMLKTVGKVVRERTGCNNIRYRLASGMGIREAKEIIEYFDLKKYLNASITPMRPFDKGVPIETEIGTFYGLAKAYDGDWIIHAFHDEPRDLYFHRMLNRTLKPFVMNYARYETRAVFHSNFTNRNSNFVQKAIFDSPLVQSKFVFGCILTSTPDGITGVDADNDMYSLDRRIAKDLLNNYGRVLRLISEIDECIAVWDGGRWGYYLHAGGIVFGCLENGKYDPFDLDVPSAMGIDKMVEKYLSGESESLDQMMDLNPAIKAIVVNQAWAGLPTDIPVHIPTVVVGHDQAEFLNRTSANPTFMESAVVSETLKGAVDFALKIAGTDKIISFDDSFGSITANTSMAKYLMEKAPEVSKQVDDHFLPLWLKQRGME